jgi:hypothetical protein
MPRTNDANEVHVRSCGHVETEVVRLHTNARCMNDTASNPQTHKHRSQPAQISAVLLNKLDVEARANTCCGILLRLGASAASRLIA